MSSVLKRLDSLAPAADTTGVLKRASRMIFDRAGLVIPAHRESNVMRNLTNVQKTHGMENITALLNALEQDPSHGAWTDFINGFTINHTAFFREPHHFVHLSKVLEEQGPLNIWCSAASTGEEPYSIAMILNEVLGEHARCPRIYATDIDTNAIALARDATYDLNRVANLTDEQIKRHFLKGVDVNEGQVRVKKFVRDRVRFGQLNLNDRSWPDIGPFDVIFCRNVMIYFNHDAQRKLLSRFARVMRPGGYLYIGHSENIVPLTNEFELLGQTVYQRNNR